MKLSTLILLGFAVVLILSVSDSYINFLLSQKVKQNTEFLSKSEAIIRTSSNLHKSIIDMQAAFRGFLLTDDKTFLDLYRNGLTEIPRYFSDQKQLVENAQQDLKLDTISALHAQWIDYADSLITAKLEVLALNAPTRTYTNLFENKLKRQVGKKINDEITLRFREFDRHEYRIRENRREQLIASLDKTRVYSIIFLALTIFIGIICSVYIVSLISRRIASMVRLAESISKGNFSQVEDNKNDELTGLSKSLNVMSESLSKNIHELERRNKELNQFAYVVSHDLKAPVRGIYNVVQWIEEDMGDRISPELRRYLDFIPQRTKRMEDLINGLLDYARTREKTTAELIDTNYLVQEITESIVPREFKVEMNDLPKLYSERIKLEQVFTNLISNAVKYTPHDNGHIVISCKERQEFYEFSVKDNGIGIEPQYHEKIFQIFQTLREKNDKESTGVGLAITKKIIDDQHCTIKVKSQPGKGAEFIFTWTRNHNSHNNHS
jgi:signal transduction histidine kinase